MTRSQPCKSQREEHCGQRAWSMQGLWGGNGFVFEEQKEPSVLGGGGLQGERPEESGRRAGRC